MNTSQSNVLMRWHPTRNSAIALGTEAGMIIAYAILGQNSNNMGVAALIGLLVVPVLAVVVPVLWTLFAEHQDLSALGITSHRWLPSVLISVVFSLLILSPILFVTGFTATPERWLPMAAAGAVSLFEPLFIFGWLQLRFERDFGILPAILLGALGYALYHIGYMPGMMTAQFQSAVVFAVAFRFTMNLLVAWPLLWATITAWMCIGSNACFYNWGMVSGSGLVFVVEVILIAAVSLMARRRTAVRPLAHGV